MSGSMDAKQAVMVVIETLDYEVLIPLGEVGDRMEDGQRVVDPLPGGEVGFQPLRVAYETVMAALGDPKEDQGRLVLGTKQVTREDLADPRAVVLSYHPLDKGWFLDEGVVLPLRLGMETHALCLAADPRSTTPTTAFYQLVERENGPRWRHVMKHGAPSSVSP